ncbi:hypothetical protein E2C01_067998 [Portunus trituberculatus]|uniref:Uncharacterized protein n=1 Tax=Portunus trituberculatus TaxID=210409 RepID=A0A5B7HUM3_PORTR|nr:hypothetical protein [Portunus trituberculatus]
MHLCAVRHPPFVLSGATAADTHAAYCRCRGRGLQLKVTRSRCRIAHPATPGNARLALHSQTEPRGVAAIVDYIPSSGLLPSAKSNMAIPPTPLPSITSTPPLRTAGHHTPIPHHATEASLPALLMHSRKEITLSCSSLLSLGDTNT